MVARSARGPRKHLTVDIHCHLHVPEADELVKSAFSPQSEPMFVHSNDATREVNRKQQETIISKLTDVTTRLKDMDKAGIDIQAVSPAPFHYFYWADPELGLASSQMVNNRIAEVVHGNPDRFVGLGTVPMQAPELAVAELERMVKELGFRGVEINSNVVGEDLSAERFRPFFAKAQELDILIFMHPSGFTDGRRLADHYFINVIGNPLDSTVAVSHLIFGGVLDAYPKLKMCIAHGGGFLPAYSGRMDHAHGARPDCRRVIKKKPTSYLKKLYFDTIVFTPHQLEYLVGLYGSDHILLGTDYPYDMAMTDPVGFIESAKLKRDEKAALMGGNAARLLKLRAPAKAASAKKGTAKKAAAKSAPAKKVASTKKTASKAAPAKRAATAAAPAKKAAVKKAPAKKAAGKAVAAKRGTRTPAARKARG
jgi:aminocarboxymuconate-semialdehyde decarboxylase